MRIGVAGIGAVGGEVAKSVDRGDVPGCKLSGISARTVEKAAALNEALRQPVPVLDFADLAEASDCVVEALPPALFGDLAELVLRAGKKLIVLSASQLLGRDDLISIAGENGGHILVASGAILGLDALNAAKIGGIYTVKIITRKPVDGLIKAPFVARSGIDLTSLNEPIPVMSGSVTDVAREFPANVNVAAAVSLAGLGPDETRMEVWADPNLTRNTHTVEVTSESSDFTMSIKNRPSTENPATGIITARSVIALLRRFNSTLQVGT
ncbi:MAG: aspartate dehydrogenase [Alphaproteobacteria bacterium]